jgi:hypothetical protein
VVQPATANIVPPAAAHSQPVAAPQIMTMDAKPQIQQAFMVQQQQVATYQNVPRQFQQIQQVADVPRPFMEYDDMVQVVMRNRPHFTYAQATANVDTYMRLRVYQNTPLQNTQQPMPAPTMAIDVPWA